MSQRSRFARALPASLALIVLIAPACMGEIRSADLAPAENDETGSSDAARSPGPPTGTSVPSASPAGTSEPGPSGASGDQASSNAIGPESSTGVDPASGTAGGPGSSTGSAPPAFQDAGLDATVNPGSRHGLGNIGCGEHVCNADTEFCYSACGESLNDTLGCVAIPSSCLSASDPCACYIDLVNPGDDRPDAECLCTVLALLPGGGNCNEFLRYCSQ